jgi:RIO-like serine/threonine protein kinase
LSIVNVQGKELCAENLDDEVSNNIKTAFAEIHRLGVIHGDIRKQNIMVKEDKSVVVLDFETSVYHENLSDDMIRDENEVIQRVLKEVKRGKSGGPRLAEKTEE